MSLEAQLNMIRRNCCPRCGGLALMAMHKRAARLISYDSLPLGEMPDGVLADIIGVSHQAVSRARNRRGISPYVEIPGERRPHWVELLDVLDAGVVAGLCRVPQEIAEAAEARIEASRGQKS